MAKLSREDVLELAELAKLELSESEVNSFRREISQILGYVEQLQAVDTTGLEPTYQVSGLKNVMRKDTTTPYQATPSELLMNVPETSEGFIKVKKIL